MIVATGKHIAFLTFKGAAAVHAGHGCRTIQGYCKQGLLDKPIKHYLSGAPFKKMCDLFGPVDVVMFDELMDAPPPVSGHHTHKSLLSVFAAHRQA